jgi:cytochrome P450
MSMLTTLRRRTPTLSSMPLPRSLDDRLLHHEYPASALAEPPAGSGLKPVMGDFGMPFLGHAIAEMRYAIEFGLPRYRRYGPVSWGGILGQKSVSICGPEACAVVYANKDKAFSQDGWNFFIDKFFHRGLMLLDFEEHHLHRRIMQQAFTRPRLAGYAAQYGPVIADGVAALPTDRKFPLYWAFKQLTLDVATQVFMGMPRGPESAKINRAFVNTVRASTAFVRYPIPGGRWAAGLRGRKLLERYFTENLPAKRRSDGEDLFAALCHATDEDGARFTDEDVVNHMIFLMMAAHDTSTITSTSAAYYLGKFPEWQERARAESLALGDGPVDIEALDSLHTLDLVIKEALRLVAPVPMMARRTVKDTEVLGHYIPAGQLVGVAPMLNHYLSEYWTTPFHFDPERFAEGRREDKSHRLAWIPFGGGAHKCIGMQFGIYEVKALLHEMLRRYTWQLPAEYHVRWDNTALPVPADGLPVQLDQR